MDVLRHQTEQSQVIGLKNRTVIPCPNGFHLCLVRGGLTYNTELRGERMPAAADALFSGMSGAAARARLSKPLWPLFAFAVGAALVSFCYLIAGFWALLVPSCILLRLLGKAHYGIADGEQS